MADQAGEYPTIIGPDAVFKGELKFEKGVKHLGRFEGQIQSDGNLLVAEGATLAGDAQAGNIQVDGEVKGNLRASSRVKLTATAKLEGDLNTPRLEVADGAVFIGRCVVGPDSSGNGRSKPAEPAREEIKSQTDAQRPKPAPAVAAAKK